MQQDDDFTKTKHQQITKLGITSSKHSKRFLELEQEEQTSLDQREWISYIHTLSANRFFSFSFLKSASWNSS